MSKVSIDFCNVLISADVALIKGAKYFSMSGWPLAFAIATVRATLSWVLLTQLRAMAAPRSRPSSSATPALTRPSWT
jgi:hypothetical protein